MRRSLTSLALATLAAVGCGDGGPPPFDYPRDGELRLEELQARGTHNSYHIAPDPFVIADWNYTHSPLGDQLEGGMRQFELDLYIDADYASLRVFHLPNLDPGTTCATFVDCLRQLKDWSDEHPAHHPIAVMLEIKDAFDPEIADLYLSLIDDSITEVWPRDRLVTPDLVRGDAAGVGQAIAERGWPTLGEVRGRALFFLLDHADYRDAYTGGGAGLAGRVAFVNSRPGDAFAGVAVLDNPVGNGAAIADALAANMLVRTRIDVLTADGYQIDPALRDAALASGAQFLSTDDETFAVPGGSPSRCNPITAPADCDAAAIEDPQFF